MSSGLLELASLAHAFRLRSGGCFLAQAFLAFVQLCSGIDRDQVHYRAPLEALCFVPGGTGDCAGAVSEEPLKEGNGSCDGGALF